jgi:hypothetical protein
MAEPLVAWVCGCLPHGMFEMGLLFNPMEFFGDFVRRCSFMFYVLNML